MFEKKMMAHFNNPLIEAARSGSDRAVELYLAQHELHGLAKDVYGRSALMYSAARGRDGWVRLLLPHSNPLAQDNYGSTALIFAAIKGHEGCVRLLLPKSDPLAKDGAGRSASQGAMDHGYHALAEMINAYALAQQEADVLDALVSPEPKLSHRASMQRL